MLLLYPWRAANSTLFEREAGGSSRRPIPSPCRATAVRTIKQSDQWVSSIFNQIYSLQAPADLELKRLPAAPHHQRGDDVVPDEAHERPAETGDPPRLLGAEQPVADADIRHSAA